MTSLRNNWTYPYSEFTYACRVKTRGLFLSFKCPSIISLASIAQFNATSSLLSFNACRPFSICFEIDPDATGLIIC